jgi:hypothetical protein
MARPRRPVNTPRFESGAKVRVKRAVRDPDFPDVPLGGWAGTVKGVHRAKGG